jgi:hypothetical protein
LKLNEDDKIAIPGENGGEIAFFLVPVKNRDVWRFFLRIKSDWFQCGAKVDFSTETMMSFVHALGEVVGGTSAEAELFSGNSNFSVLVISKKLGHVALTGDLSKDMADGSLVKFKVASDSYSLEVFFHALKSVVAA